MSINLKARIGKLNGTCRQAAERAASFCMAYRNYEVDQEYLELHTLDMGLLQAGAGVEGAFENHLKNVIDEVKKNPQVFDEGAMGDARGREVDFRSCLITGTKAWGRPCWRGVPKWTVAFATSTASSTGLCCRRSPKRFWHGWPKAVGWDRQHQGQRGRERRFQIQDRTSGTGGSSGRQGPRRCRGRKQEGGLCRSAGRH